MISTTKKISLKLKQHFVLFELILAIVSGFCLFGYWNLIIYPIREINKHQLAIGIVELLLFVIVCYLLFHFLVLPQLKRASLRKRIVWIVGSMLVAAGLVMISPAVSANSILAPNHKLEITKMSEKNPASTGSQIELTWFNSGMGGINFHEFQAGEGWILTSGGLVNQDGTSSSLTWQGKVGNFAALVFRAGPDKGIVQLNWDGQVEKIDLYAPESKDIPAEHQFTLPPNRQLVARFFSFFSGFFLILCLLVFFPPFSVESMKFIKSWLPLALPMIMGWMVYLLTFWPGIIYADTVVQWRQVVSGAFIDNHPAFETMLLWLVTRIWQTPSMMAIFQIFALSLVMACGLGELLRLGTPKWAVWGLSVLMGVSVLNGFMAAAIWKDTPYAIAVMGFTVLLLKIVTTNGKFLESGKTWFWLGAVGALMPLFRHNGIALPIATLPVLLIAYRRYWKPILASIVCFVCLWLGVRGPLYDLLNVDKTQSVGDYFIIHHIGAYVDAGVPLTTEQTNFLSALRPLDQWNYNCCTVNTIIFESFNVNFLNANPGKPIGILLDLIKQDPAIDLRHFMCVSSPYWNINPVCPPLMGNWSSNYKRNLSWVDPNEFGFKEQSMFPVLANLIGGWIVSDKITILWEPAPYLYLLLILIVVIMFRTRNVRYLLVWLPTVVQTAVIIVLSMVPQTRYQFSTALVAVWSVGMLFLTRTQANKDS